MEQYSALENISLLLNQVYPPQIGGVYDCFSRLKHRLFATFHPSGASYTA